MLTCVGSGDSNDFVIHVLPDPGMHTVSGSSISGSQPAPGWLNWVPLIHFVCSMSKVQRALRILGEVDLEVSGTISRTLLTCGNPPSFTYS